MSNKIPAQFVKINCFKYSFKYMNERKNCDKRYRTFKIFNKHKTFIMIISIISNLNNYCK